MASNSTDYETFKEQGNQMYRADNFKGAKELYTKAIGAQRKAAVAYSNRAACELRLGEYFHALADCNKAIDFDDKFCKAYFRRGKALRGLFRYNLALNDFKKVLTFDAGNKEATREIKELEEILRDDCRIIMNNFEKPEEFRSKKPLQKFKLNNCYSGEKKYTLK